MIKSMTGYGKAECEVQSKNMIIEIKSLNSKQLDLNIRIPSVYKEKEFELRNEISRSLIRGKVDFYISTDSTAEEMPVSVNKNVIRSYFQQVSEVAKELNLIVPNDILSSLLRLPDALKAEKLGITDSEWEAVLCNTKIAIELLNQFRCQEGKALENDMVDRINLITCMAIDLEPFEKQRVEKLKIKLKQSLDELSIEKIDQNRFEQELIYYLEKLDITEEKVRLANHCSYFMETIAEAESSGKKLAFIVQEIGREINTIGSKANDSDMQKIVVSMKDELEKIKEQINNVL